MRRSVLRRFLRLLPVLLASAVSGSFFHYSIGAETALRFPPTPQENTYEGRNSNAYLPAVGGVTEERKRQFVESLTPLAVAASARWGIPASAIIGMAIHESGYGTTRIAHYANNLFGIKVWGPEPDNAWQLKGQPLEDAGRVRLHKDLGPDRKIYDESARVDNWYRIFADYGEAVEYLAGVFLQRPRYLPAREAYLRRLGEGWDPRDAARRYVYDIAEAGYNHLGGTEYLKRVGAVMDQWNLYAYDAKAVLPHDAMGILREPSVFPDTAGHWAQRSIERLAKAGIVSGFGDGTFRPDEPVTVEQFLKMAVLAAGPEKPWNEADGGAPAGPWSSAYLAAAERMGIAAREELAGAPDRGAPVTRQAMAAFAARALQLSPAAGTLPFADRSRVEAPYAEWVGAAVEAGIVHGFADGTFRPRLRATRAQAAEVIGWMLDYLEQTR